MVSMMGRDGGKMGRGGEGWEEGCEGGKRRYKKVVFNRVPTYVLLLRIRCRVNSRIVFG